MNTAVGTFISEWLRGLGQITLLAKESLASVFRRRVAWRDLIYQMYFIGVKSQSVVLVTGGFTGMVLAAQTYFQFHKIKMDTGVLALVGVSMCSELGPVLTGLMVAGRAGAAMAAELGTMRVTEQIDALASMGVNPVKYLVLPRFLAALLMLPVLTVFSDIIGVAGGLGVSVFVLDANPTIYMKRTFDYLEVADVYGGLLKAVVFGGIIALVSCQRGFHAKGGAEGVGQATTGAVVVSCVLILISDYIMTALLY